MSENQISKVAASLSELATLVDEVFGKPGVAPHKSIVGREASLYPRTATFRERCLDGHAERLRDMIAGVMLDVHKMNPAAFPALDSAVVSSARLQAAEVMSEMHEYPGKVTGMSGWSEGPDCLRRNVFLSADGYDSDPVVLSVYFRPGSADIRSSEIINTPESVVTPIQVHL